MSWFAKVFFATTAITPALLTYSIAAYLADNIREAVVLVVVAAILGSACFAILRYMRRHLEPMNFNATSVEVADQESISLLLICILPLLRPQFDFLEVDLQVWVLVLLVFIGVMMTGYGYHFNPLLNLIGWHFYKVNTVEGVTYVLITKKQLRKAIGTIKIGQVTEYMLIDLGGVEDG